MGHTWPQNYLLEDSPPPTSYRNILSRLSTQCERLNVSFSLGLGKNRTAATREGQNCFMGLKTLGRQPHAFLSLTLVHEELIHFPEIFMK